MKEIANTQTTSTIIKWTGCALGAYNTYSGNIKNLKLPKGYLK
jgi:hypothetical protein